MKTTKPKPGAVAKRKRPRVRKPFLSADRRAQLGVWWTVSGIAISLSGADSWAGDLFTPATARRIAKALLATAGGTP